MDTMERSDIAGQRPPEGQSREAMANLHEYSSTGWVEDINHRLRRLTRILIVQRIRPLGTGGTPVSHLRPRCSSIGPDLKLDT